MKTSSAIGKALLASKAFEKGNKSLNSSKRKTKNNCKYDGNKSSKKSSKARGSVLGRDYGYEGSTRFKSSAFGKMGKTQIFRPKARHYYDTNGGNRALGHIVEYGSQGASTKM